MDKFIPQLVLCLLFPMALLPLPVARGVGAGIGLLAYRLIGKLRRRVETAMTESLPAMIRMNPALTRVSAPTLARQFFANLGRFFLEVLKIYFGLGQRLLTEVEFRGIEHYEQAKAAGRGVIFFTAHCGNWEALGLAFGLQFDPLTVVVRHQRSPQVTEMLARLRHRFGNETILKDGAARKVYTVIKRGGNVGIFSDIAVPQREGILTNFLGRPAWTTPLPAIIAQKTGCALLPAFIHREGPRLVVEFHPRLAVEGLTAAEITADLALHIEQHIARHPDEWFWLYRRWKGAPAPMAVDGQTDI